MSDIFAKNMKVLRKRMPILSEAIEKLAESDCDYIVTEAKSGAKTLSIKKGDKVFQVHSKYDPIKEAHQQLENAKFINPKIMMVLGLGLGYTVRAATEIYGDKNIYTIVVEKDVKSLKVAMEHVDLTDLFLNHKLIWVVGIRHDESFVVLNELIKKVGLPMQMFLKTFVAFDHPVLTKVHEGYHQHILNCFKEASFNIIFNYGNCPNDSMVGLQNIMDNLSLILRSPGVKDLNGKARNLPGIIVSTGPSLDKNIEALKLAEGKCIMVAADSALKVLHKHNIVPHMAVSVERIQNVTTMFSELPDDYKKKIWLGACPVILKSAYDAWCGPKFMVYRDFAHFQWLEIPKGTLVTGPSCSNLAFKVLESMGCNPIILVGQDCAFASAEKTHADGASAVTNLHLKEKNLIKVKGNYSDFVYTNQIYDMFRKAFETDMLTYKGNCINATEGGAYIEGTKIMTLKEAIEKFCKQPIDALDILQRGCHYPTTNEIAKQWKSFRQIMADTRKEVNEVIEQCLDGERHIAEFEERLDADGFKEIDDFINRFPDDELDKITKEMLLTKKKIITGSKYFNLYLMHMVQMIIVRYEMEINGLPSMCEDEKRCKLQFLKLMKKWFPEVGGVCQLAQKILVDAFNKLDEEFKNI